MSKYIITILCAGLLMACQTRNESITSIPLAKQLEMSQDPNVVVVDVRTPGEVAQCYIKGTDQFIDYNGTQFKEQIAALDKDKTYIVYCRSGNRSTKALNAMAELGFTKLYELEGGIKSVSNPADLVK